MLTNKIPEKDVNQMFTRVAPKYDLMNNVVSLGTQKLWRRKFIKQLRLNNDSLCLDLCCGTGDSTIDLAKKAKLTTGLDFNQKMLQLAHQKLVKKHLQAKIKLVQGDAMALPFAANSFDCVTICFGLRNVPDAAKTVAEALRVLKPGGEFAILEMSQPKNPLVKFGWKSYFKMFPYLAKLTGSQVKDYQYLSKSSREFLSAEALKKLLEQTGFVQTAFIKLNFGAGAIHTAFKPSA